MEQSLQLIIDRNGMLRRQSLGVAEDLALGPGIMALLNEQPTKGGQAP